MSLTMNAQQIMQQLRTTCEYTPPVPPTTIKSLTQCPRTHPPESRSRDPHPEHCGLMETRNSGFNDREYFPLKSSKSSHSDAILSAYDQQLHCSWGWQHHRLVGEDHRSLPISHSATLASGNRYASRKALPQRVLRPRIQRLYLGNLSARVLWLYSRANSDQLGPRTP